MTEVGFLWALQYGASIFWPSINIMLIGMLDTGSLAQELGLDKPQTGPNIRQNINRTRAWLNTYCVDGSHATQFGKMPMVKLDDYIVRTSARSWYKSVDSAPYDIGLCGYAELLMLMARFRQTLGSSDDLAKRYEAVSFTGPGGHEAVLSPDQGFDVVETSIRYDKDMTALSAYWYRTLDADTNVQICKISLFLLYS